MHFHFKFDACPVLLPFDSFIGATKLSMWALFCLNSLSKVSAQLY